MKKYLVEFIGTFFLVATIGQVVIASELGPFAPVAIGGMLMCMVFAGGHISGAHYNPAITLALWMRGRCATGDIPGYVIAQIAGAWLATRVVLFMKQQPEVSPILLPAGSTVALLAEFLGTFALAFVVLNVATVRKTEGNSFYGLAIGITVMAAAFSLGGYSGGAFNPAVAIGITAMGLTEMSNIWIYLLGSIAGSATATKAFMFLHEDD